MVNRPPPRTRQPDEAFFEDEFSTTRNANGSHPNRFDNPPVGVSAGIELSNPLDRTVNPVPQPEDIPPVWHGGKSRYRIFVPQAVASTVAEAKRRRAPRPRINLTILWGVGTEIRAHGLRAMFEHAKQTVLINVPGREGGWTDLPNGTDGRTGLPAWGIGISRTGTATAAPEDQIRKIIDHAGLDYAEPSIRILAAYSTGFKGLVGSLNNDLLPLDDLVRVIFFDCLYRADEPRLPQGVTAPRPLPEERNSGPDELDLIPDPDRPCTPRERNHMGSPFNTRRALDKVLARRPRADIIAYSVTLAGSPVYLRPSTADPVQHTASVPSRGLVELRAVPECLRAVPPVPRERREAALRVNNALTALIFTRYLKTGVQDRFFTEAQVPRAFVELFPQLPPRGGIASTEFTSRARGVMPLTSWHRANENRINNALRSLGTAKALIDRHQLILPGASGLGEELHRGFIPEFGWEFLL